MWRGIQCIKPRRLPTPFATSCAGVWLISKPQQGELIGADFDLVKNSETLFMACCKPIIGSVHMTTLICSLQKRSNKLNHQVSQMFQLCPMDPALKAPKHVSNHQHRLGESGMMRRDGRRRAWLWPKLPLNRSSIKTSGIPIKYFDVYFLYMVKDTIL